MSEQPKGWEGRVAFITGAVTGIGLGVAQAFADAGMRLALGYRNEDDRAGDEGHAPFPGSLAHSFYLSPKQSRPLGLHTNVSGRVDQ